MQSLNDNDTIHPQNLSNLPLVDGSNFVEVSARLQPMRRLKMGHVLRLCNEGVFTIVIPWTDKNDNAVATDPRAHVMRGMKRIIGEWAVGDASEKREYLDKQMQKHAVTRGRIRTITSMSVSNPFLSDYCCRRHHCRYQK